ncbi:HAD-IIIC family phosphatase [Chitinophaga japonensis]|uniref:HAD superfamily phosphatase (TIGR01681 family)/FkbH-like protein n=1 Tax=Chitinophaga japonensis TaxID=104662 RepID=A0A562SM16_CHIJA|nr:HAD-IIIC family phosphatase [Chitinophaga japonensis]TWI82123.1 HAD superfamily phosphatase (TIGR01681 family)/FkbH-like protein [Chitinophaga japonensis]
MEKKCIKCVVWDLDETVWHGILSENDQLRLRDGIADAIRVLDERGIINTIASKNNAADALDKLESFGLLEYFLVPQVNWGAKSASIQRIKEQLNIGYDAIAFIDDQPFERDEVKSVLQEVHCFDVDIIAGMQQDERFIPRFITDESAKRRLMYLTDELRKQEEEQFTDNQAFLQQLQLQLNIAGAQEKDLQRVEELTLRTNQLNATGYAYTYDELLQLLQNQSYQVLVCELTDKYGSYGKIGVSMLQTVGDRWNIHLLLMSCRVMSRGVGSVLLAYIVREAMRHEKQLYADFLPTSRNRQMYITYKFAGFKEAGKLENGGIQLIHDGVTVPAIPDYLQLTATNLIPR